MKKILIGLALFFAVIWLIGRLPEPNESQTSPAAATSAVSKDTGTAGPGSTPPIPAKQPAPAPKVLGEEFSVGYWTYICQRAGWTLTWPPDGGYRVEKPDAAFLAVDVTATNNDSTASVVPPFYLIDDQGRKYESKSLLYDNVFGPLESLNPGVSKRGFIVFDVPQDRQYALLVSGGIQSGTSQVVRIASQPAETTNSQ
jgi:hypothetical protein